MLFAVSFFPRLTRFVAASLAAAVLVASAPIHAAHGHNEAAPSATLHASCAMCQAPAPAATPAGRVAAMIESGPGHLPAVDEEPAPRRGHPGSHACRAPPFLSFTR
jgi:hypothetical protein